MIDHLKARGGALDFADTKTLLTVRDIEWDICNSPQKYFNRTEQAFKSLTFAGITVDLNEQRDMALYYFKHPEPAADKTGVNIKTFISTEYARENKQNKLTAKQFRANAIEEQVEATEELIAFLTVNHTRQIKTFIKSTTKEMKEMMQLIQSQNSKQHQQFK
jgi:hypothetical protein